MRFGSKIDILFGLSTVGLAALARGDHTQAVDHFVQLLAFAREIASALATAYSLIGFGAVAVVSGQSRRAAQLFGAVEFLLRSGGIDIIVWGGTTSAVYKMFLQSAQAQLDEATFSTALAAGRALTMEQAIEYALAGTTTTPARTPRQAAKEQFGGLTAREREVAVLIAQGKSNRELAEALVVSERTVGAHVSNILSKLELASRTQIATWALEKGLVNHPG